MSGKSSLVNKITNQDVSVVSSKKGTTTDNVKKSMEILPLGPVVIIDTPGFDDNTELGKKRVEQTKKILRNCDIGVLVTESWRELNSVERELISIFKEREIEYLIVKNKSDILGKEHTTKNDDNVVFVSSISGDGIEEFKNKLGALRIKPKEIRLVGDFIKEKSVVILVTPIDESAPKGRLILPQQLAIRDVLDSHAIPIVTQVDELEHTLDSLKEKPVLVITDSQAFKEVSKIVPDDIYLTSFSILMARYKGLLNTSLEGIEVLKKLKDNSKILIAEGCTHHRQCNDIGTVKIPKLLKEKISNRLDFTWTNGMGYPDNLSEFDLIIHCGGCMLNDNEMQYRMNEAVGQNIPFTNYGMALAYLNGILERSIKILKADIE